MKPFRHRTFFDDTDTDRLGVFIPGAMGAGILVSLGLVIADLYRKAGGEKAAARRVRLTGHATTLDVVHGPQRHTTDREGMRSPKAYYIITAAFLGLAVYVAIGATWNFFNPGGYIQGIGWVWALSTLAVIAFGIIGYAGAYAWPPSLLLVIGGVGIVTTVRFGVIASSSARVLVVVGLIAATTVAFVAALGWVRRSPQVPDTVRALLMATPLTRNS